MRRRNRLAAATMALATLGLGAACSTGDSPDKPAAITYADVSANHSLANKACTYALHDLEDPGALMPQGTAPKTGGFSVSIHGTWVSEKDALECTMVGPHRTIDMRFAPSDRDGQSTDADVTATSGSLEGWLVQNPSAGWPSAAQGQLEVVTSRLAG